MKSQRPPARHRSKDAKRRDPSRKGSSPKRGKRPGSGGRAAQTTPDSLYLYGLHTVRAALDNPDREIERLIVTENGAQRIDAAHPERGALPIEVRPPAYLEQLVGSEAVHQGVVLHCKPLNMLDASELFHLADAKLILALDQLTDPHNVGAILRSASALGADAVLTTSRNSAHETAVLAKSASGALDTIRLISLRNLSKSLEELNEMGFFSIGLDSEGPLVLEETLTAHNVQKVILVLGAENKGLRQKTRETCSALARLDMPGPIKSLNVSNAATLSLYAVTRHLLSSSR